MEMDEAGFPIVRKVTPLLQHQVFIGFVALQHEVREGVREFIETLHEAGVRFVYFSEKTDRECKGTTGPYRSFAWLTSGLIRICTSSRRRDGLEQLHCLVERVCRGRSDGLDGRKVSIAARHRERASSFGKRRRCPVACAALLALHTKGGLRNDSHFAREWRSCLHARIERKASQFWGV